MYDIHIQIASETERAKGPFYLMSFGFNRTISVIGLQKLLNIFTKYLLTPVGSNPLDLTEGTELPNLIGSNVASYDTEDIVILAVAKTTTAIQRAQRSREVPDDERLASASVTSFIASESLPGFSAQILIRNIENEGLIFNLPTLTLNV